MFYTFCVIMLLWMPDILLFVWVHQFFSIFSLFFLFFSLFLLFCFFLHLLCWVCNIVKLTVTMGGQHLMSRYLSSYPPMLFTIVWLFTVLWFWWINSLSPYFVTHEVADCNSPPVTYVVTSIVHQDVTTNYRLCCPPTCDATSVGP